jgi:uncharacterized protein YaaW (UPF0174 family)
MEPSYVEKMKEWLDLDNKGTRLRDELAEINEEKKELEEEILTYVERNGLDKVTVNVSDGSLKFPKRNTQQSISLKYLKTTLSKYNEEQSKINVDDLYKYLVSNLETKTKMYIKRDVR